MMSTSNSAPGQILPLAASRRRNLPASAAFGWLRAGWRDLCTHPWPSLVYGIAVFAVSLAIVWSLFAFKLDYILFPALAGFMVVGPLIAIGLYQKSRAIEQGSLAGRGLEIAWVEDRIDAFFAHVQGAVRLKFADGGTMRLTYAAKSGHPFTAIGRILVETGEISAAEISMQSIRRWLRDHPGEADELMWRNRSYIFFR